MKEVFIIISLLVILLFLGDLHISFSPFSVTLPKWHVSVSILLFGIAIGLYSYGNSQIQYDKGYNDAIKDVEEIIRKKEDSCIDL